MRARLFCPVGELKGSDFEIRGEATLGRGSESTILLPSRSVSTTHARIFFDGEEGHFLLEDLGSLNGTKLDGAKIKGREVLGPLHVITLGGKHELIFQDLGAFPEALGAVIGGDGARQASTPEEGTMVEQAPPMPPMSIPAFGAPSVAAPGTTISPPAEVGVEGTLVDQELPDLPSILAGDPVIEGTMVDRDLPQLPSILAGGVSTSQMVPKDSPSSAPKDSPIERSTSEDLAREAPAPRGLLLEVRALTGELSRSALEEGDNIVGRDAGAAVHIPNASVSRNHAMLAVKEGAVTVRDLGSRNKTFVDDEEVSVTEPMSLAAGAVVRFGNVEASLIVEEFEVEEPRASGGGEESS